LRARVLIDLRMVFRVTNRAHGKGGWTIDFDTRYDLNGSKAT
jgi:hypothetical protein